MPADDDEIIDAVGDVGNANGIRCALKESGKGAAIVGTISFAGALLFGPIGLAVGGAIGGGSAYLVTRGNFKSLREVLKGMSSKEKKALVEEIKKVTGIFENVAKEIRNRREVQLAALTAVLAFIRRVMKMEVYEGKG